MPIYAYRCTACGHAQDVLQKMSDAVLTVCPACGAEAYAKQVTAAGFQLKGSGWYVTDFRGGAGAKPAAEGAVAAKPVEGAAPGKPAADAKPADKPADSASKPAAAPVPAAPAPSPTPSSGG